MTAAAPTRTHRTLSVLLVGFPIWWLAGLGQFVWLLAIPFLFLALWSRPRLVVPQNFALLVGFAVWTLASFARVDGLGRAFSFAHRTGLYACGLLVLLVIVNTDEHSLPRRTIAIAVGAMVTWLTIGGWLGVIFGGVVLRAPIEVALPGFLANDPFVLQLVRPRFAQVQDFLGFDLARPSAPFPYTNEWGATLSLTLPLLFALWGDLPARLRRPMAVVLVALIVPVIVSANRGLWLTIVVVGAYLAVRFALRGRTAALRVGVIVVAIASFVVLFTPLGELVTARLDSGHSDESRSSLYIQVIEGVPEAPIIGHGTPRANEQDPLRPPVGTHGQLWQTLWSTGIPGALFYCGFMAAWAWRSRKWRTTSDLWLHATIVAACVHLPFYDHYALSLVVIAIAIGLRSRRTEARLDERVTRRWREAYGVEPESAVRVGV